MTRADFLFDLGDALGQLPEDERQRRLEYYSELIDDMTEDGMTEAEAIESLGSVETLAGEILQDTALPILVKSAVKPKKGWTPLSITLAVVGSPIWVPIAIALAAVLLSVYIVIWSVVVSMFAVVLSFFAAGVGCLGLLIFRRGGAELLTLAGFGLGGIGLGILSFYGTLYVTRAVVKLTAIIGRFIKSLFIRR
jgi:uncharacterized membrane protein